LSLVENSTVVLVGDNGDTATVQNNSDLIKLGLIPELIDGGDTGTGNTDAFVADSLLSFSGTTTEVTPGENVDITVMDQFNSVTITVPVAADGSYRVDNLDIKDLKDGELTIKATTFDRFGNPIEDEATTVLDRVEGQLTVDGVIDNDAATLDISGTTKDVAEDSDVMITITDVNGDVVTVMAIVQEDSTYSVPDVDVSSLANGELQIEATTTDNNGKDLNAEDTVELQVVDPNAGQITIDKSSQTLDYTMMRRL
jgi:hypothetical protein